MPTSSADCPGCGEPVRLTVRTISGNKVRCPACALRFSLPDEESDEPSGERRGRRSAPPRPKSTGRMLFVVLGSVGLFLVLACGGALVGSYFWLTAPTSFPEQTEDYPQARVALPHPARAFGARAAGLAGRGAAPRRPGGRVRLGRVAAPSLGQFPLPGPPRPAVLFLHNGFAFGATTGSKPSPSATPASP